MSDEPRRAPYRKLTMTTAVERKGKVVKPSTVRIEHHDGRIEERGGEMEGKSANNVAVRLIDASRRGIGAALGAVFTKD